MRHRQLTFTLSGATCAVVLVAALAPILGSLEAGLVPAASAQGDFDVVADGLLNPRGLALAGDTLLVSEGGTGEAGDGFVPGNGDGRVTEVSLADPSQRTVVVDGLGNSVDPGGGVVGANHALWRDAAATSDTFLVALSGGAGHPDPKARILLGDPGGVFLPLIDLWAFEEANNPAGGIVDSNPWRMTRGSDSMLYIADAGADAVLKADPATGDTTVYAVFGPVGKNDQGDDISPVPAGMAFDPGAPGVLYVSLLGSVVPGEAEVHRLQDGNGDGDARDPGEDTIVLGGLTMADDLAFDPAGRLFALEFGGLAAAGRLLEVTSGSPGVVVDGLPAASALVFTPAGDALVAVGDGQSGWITDRVVRVPAQMLIAPTATATEPAPTATPPEGTPTSEAGFFVFLPACKTS